MVDLQKLTKQAKQLLRHMSKCEVCEKGTLREKKVRNYEYTTPMGIVTIEGESKFEKCDHCGEIFIPGSLLDYWNRLILVRILEKKGFIQAAELQFIFSVLPYSQSEIATAAGKERSTLTKYKNGENPIDPLFDDALRNIVRDHLEGKDDTIVRLQSRHKFLFDKEKIKKVSGSGH